MKKDILPKIGKTVHYVNYRGDPGKPSQDRVGMIVGVWFNTSEEKATKENCSPENYGYGVASCDLVVFTSAGFFFNKHVTQDEFNRSGGTWHWPDD